MKTTIKNGTTNSSATGKTNLSVNKKVNNLSDSIVEGNRIDNTSDLDIKMKRMLTLGFFEIIDDNIEDVRLSKLPEEEQAVLIDAASFLRAIISEATKTSEYRNINKMAMFLNMALDRVDRFYAKNPDLSIFNRIG